MITPEENFMQQAIDLAKKGAGKVSPNPLVGTVIVKDGEIIGQGYHQHYGGPHAEINAIGNRPVSGATMYVTLEPCNHYGNTPPCVERIVSEKIKRVVIGSIDPDSRMQGKSVEYLETDGIETRIGILNNETDEIIRFYAHWKRKKRPYVTIKLALTSNDCIAQVDGKSKWISSLTSRKEVHQMRGEYDAIMVGTNTVLVDNPALTTRHVSMRNPNRVVIDRMGKIGPRANIFVKNTNKIFYFSQEIRNDLPMWVKQTVLSEQTFSLETILGILGEQNQISLLVEGGGMLANSFIEGSLCNEVIIYRSPILFENGIQFDHSFIENKDLFEICYQSPSGDDLKTIYRGKHV